jgi:glycosyltransferase involved in cell wall biosynthesis
MGARHNYAVPRMLHERGALAALCTDLIWRAGVNHASRLKQVIESCYPQLARRNPDLPDKVVRSFPDITLFGGLVGRFSSTLQYSVEDWLLGAHSLAVSTREANVVYSMFGSGESFLKRARSRGLLIATDVFITPVAHRVVARERSIFRGWEADDTPANVVVRIEDKVKRMLAFSDVLICPSQTVIDGLGAYEGFIRSKAILLPYGMSSVYCERGAPEKGRVLFAGTATLRKGIAYLARAAEQLKEDCPEIKVVVAGPVVGTIRKRKETRALKFLGMLSRDQMLVEFLRADVFVLPSLAEGSASVIYEALGAGVPVVTTHSSGSVVTDGVEGLIVPERDSSAIALALKRIVRDRALRNSMSAAAHRTAKNYDTVAWGDRLLSVLGNLLRVNG